MKVLLVDDHLVVLRGLRFFLSTQEDIEIIGEVENGEAAMKAVEEQKPDIVLMDLMMPVMDGVEATKRLKESHPEVKVVILSSFSDQDHVIPALQAGATGYQLKDVEPDVLVETIRKAAKGEKYLHPKATDLLMSEMTSDVSKETALIHDLTKREKEVLEQITLGKSNKEISNDLYITEKTVKTHVSHILSKLEVHDRTQAAIYAMKNRLFESS
ncbi:response regulator transcription factor [Halobacillus locisalis]|uniref:Response regulator transcription factor n=1 Tax=Halobacillus locisalis TaxID=220753 RepID=A0A838CXQ1_9BACI|nr:response regulator transcription factor [Halobacillus locisalis]